VTAHKAQVPPAAADYFRALQAGDHPVITRRFRPDRGWKPYPLRKRVSENVLRQEQAAGYTHVELTAGGHSPEFTIAELLASCAQARRARAK
jgi:hypothetical protein